MSAVIPQALSKVLVVDPMCDFQSEAVYAVEKATSNSNYYNITSNNYSTQSTTWTVNCNDNTTITDRLFLMDITLKLSIPIANGVYPNNPVNGIGGLRSFPLLKWSNNYVLTLGNATSTLQSGQIANLIERYGFMDKYLNYGSFPNFCDSDVPYNSNATTGNPFNSQQWLQSETCLPRGAFSPIRIDQNGADPAYGRAGYITLSYRIVEPIFLSPLLQSMSIKARKEGMTKLSQIQFTVNWGNPNRLWSSTTALLGNVEVEMGDNILRVVQYVPSALDIGRNLTTQALPYNEIVSFATETAQATPLALKANATTFGLAAGQTFTSQVVQLSRIPKEMYIFCRPTDTVYNNPATGTTCCDTFASYVSQSLKINFNGQNLLNSISDVSLYRICVENGCNIPYSSWSGKIMKTWNLLAANNGGVGNNVFGAGVGSPICLKFGKDIVLPPELAPGTLSKCNLQVECAFASSIAGGVGGTAYAGASLPHTMYITIVYEGVIEFYGSGGTVSQTLGALTVNDVLEASKRNERVHYDIVNNGTYGGAMVDHAKNFVKGKANHLLNRFRSVLSHPSVAPHVNEAVEAMVGRGMSGGKSMSKASLKRALLG
jgi:hypothetical protein